MCGEKGSKQDQNILLLSQILYSVFTWPPVHLALALGTLSDWLFTEYRTVRLDFALMMRTADSSDVYDKFRNFSVFAEAW